MALDEQPHDRGWRKNRAPSQLQPAVAAPGTGMRWGFQRTTAPGAGVTVKVDSPVEQGTPKVERRQSKMSLFNLFAPPKVERSRGYTEAALQTVTERQPSPHASVRSRKPPRPVSSMSLLRADEPAARHSLLSSGASIRTMSSSDGWDPPPLFQAYPQAIKYATLQAPTVSTATLQKAQGHKRQLSQLQEQFESSVSLTLDTEDMAGISTPAKPERSTLSKKRLSTAPPGGAPLASKVYVLVTSGYLLQYSGEGSSNRMPERVLSLDVDSVAFASDLIPGKHFVLQVQQRPHEHGSSLAVPRQQQSRSLLQRLRSQPQAAKRSANTMLLILDGADEMISWMKAVRRVIDDKNGHRPTSSVETGSKRDSGHFADDGSGQLPSHRYRVQRPADFASTGANRNNPPAVLRASSFGPPPGSGAAVGEAGRGVEDPVRSRVPGRLLPLITSEGSAQSTEPTPRASVRESVEAPSVSTSTSAVSQDQFNLDRLRDSKLSLLSNRTSATGNVTLTTSSGPPSPEADGSPPNAVTGPAASRSSYILVNTPIGPRRRSIQRLPVTTEASTSNRPEVSRPLATLQQSRSESNLLASVVKSPSEKNLRRLSTQTTTVPLRMRLSTGPSFRSQSALEHRRVVDPRASAGSAASIVTERPSAPVDDQQSEHEAATDAAAELASMMEPDPRRQSTLGSLPNLSNPSLLSLHRQQQAQDKDRIPATLREKYQSRRKERPPPLRTHVRTAEEEAAAAQIQAILDPDSRGAARTETSADLVDLPLELQYRQQQQQDKSRVSASVRQKFQSASTARISESEERIDQEAAAAQIQSIMDPEEGASSSGAPGKLPVQSLQAMYRSQQNQDRNRIPAELRNKFKAAANARHFGHSEEISSEVAAAQIQSIMDPAARAAPGSGLPAKPEFQSLQSMHKNQMNQDKERIPAATRKKYQRPIPIRVAQPGQNVDRPLPKASPSAEQPPIIPKRLSSLPSPPPRAINSPPLPPSPNIAHFPQPPKRTSLMPLAPIMDTPSAHYVAGSNNNSPTLPAMSNQPTSADPPTSQGLRRPASLQVRSTAAPFLSSRPQPNSGARRSFTPTNAAASVRSASVQAGSVARNGRASPGPAVALSGLPTVGEARTLRAMGPSDPLKQASERLALRSGTKRAESPIGMKVRVSMPTISINGPPVRIEPMLPTAFSLDSLPAPPGPPPSCALPAVPGPPPSRALPAIPGSARTSLRSSPTPTPQTVNA